MNKRIFNMRLVGFTLYIVAAFLLQAFIDPMTELTKGTGVGRIIYILTVVSSASIIYLAIHLIWKMVFYYPEADRRSMFAQAIRTPEGAGYALIGAGLQMLIITASILIALLL